ncbi:hypothetical protein OKW50_008305 [Paraburkholderia youngii]
MSPSIAMSCASPCPVRSGDGLCCPGQAAATLRDAQLALDFLGGMDEASMLEWGRVRYRGA